MRKFNITGNCIKKKHYMVDISKKLEKIKAMVDDECYFTINRARQYGKTTTLYHLQEMLKSEYICLKISFEGGDKMFLSAEDFCKGFLQLLDQETEIDYANIGLSWGNESVNSIETLGNYLSEICKDYRIVLLIDEVDRSSNNHLFLNFLGMLRNKHIQRNAGRGHTFHSVILAGVHDIKNIKQKMITAGTHTQSAGEGNYNSPWNIAAKFKVDMSFSPAEIETMLSDYEEDHATGMNIPKMAQEIYNYTGGYPFLVSDICKIIDEDLDENWTAGGVQFAVKMLLKERNTLFDDIIKNLENSKELSSLIFDLLIMGRQISFVLSNPLINLGAMYGFIKESNNRTAISNTIFELYLADYFISKEETKKYANNQTTISDVVKNNKFDMETCLRKFAQHYFEMFRKEDVSFLERHGRMLFLMHLRPLINGVGFYHIETETRDNKRFDIVVDYGDEQFIIELKLWYGDKKHEEAYEQLLDYMSIKNAQTGYLLTFDFRKEVNKERKEEWVEFDGGRRIFDVMV